MSNVEFKGHWVASLMNPLPMRNAGERIAERIVTAIALGEFVPGQKLPSERELASMLQTSRGVIREAIQRLAASGYLVVKRGRDGGSFVTDHVGPELDGMIRRVLMPEWDRVEQLLDARSLLESEIARTAAERRNSYDQEAITRAVESYRSADTDRLSSGEADRHLHVTIARATHNSVLVDLSLQLRKEVSLGFGVEPFSKEIRVRALDQHPKLAEAVIDGDSETAAKLARSHFSLTEDLIRSLFHRITPEEDGNDVIGN
jgi:GntR family transcriptional repressor for pyruvate dehydrogenase complex